MIEEKEEAARPNGPPHLSHSRINRYLLCPEQYRLYYIEKLRPRRFSAALVFGQAIHQALAAFFRTGTDAAAAFGRRSHRRLALVRHLIGSAHHFGYRDCGLKARRRHGAKLRQAAGGIIVIRRHLQKLLGKGALGSGKREILTLFAGWEFQDHSHVYHRSQRKLMATTMLRNTNATTTAIASADRSNTVYCRRSLSVIR